MSLLWSYIKHLTHRDCRGLKTHFNEICAGIWYATRLISPSLWIMHPSLYFIVSSSPCWLRTNQIHCLPTNFHHVSGICWQWSPINNNIKKLCWALWVCTVLYLIACCLIQSVVISFFILLAIWHGLIT